MNTFEKKNIEDIFALTPMQEGMLFHYLHEPESDYYYEQLSLEISGKIDPEIFEKAWNRVIQINEMLRAVFRWEKSENPVQLILKEYRFKPQYSSLKNITAEDGGKKFDLKEIPFRVTLCSHSGDKNGGKDGDKDGDKDFDKDHINTMIISNHHILYDGWSNGIILKEFFTAYSRLSKGEPLRPPHKKKFKEFVKWSLSRDTAKEESFWNNYLLDFDARSDLSIKRNKSEKRENNNAGNLQFLFSPDLESRLQGFVRKHKITLASLLYTAWGILLQRYNNCSDVIFGTTISGRNSGLKGIEETVGLFINTLPLRIRSENNTKMADLAVQVYNQLQLREQFPHTPLIKIKEYGKIENNEELFDTLVIVENYPLDRQLKSGSGPLTVRGFSMTERTHYPLTVSINLFDRIEVNFAYHENYFDRESIVRLARHFESIIGHFPGSPGLETGAVDMLSAEEKEQLLVEFNRTAVDYPSAKTIHQLLEEQVEKSPAAVAVTCQRKTATFGQLNERANRLARLLRDQGIGPGHLVGLMPDRSIEMLTGLFAILKAGGAYIPLGPEYPLDRVALILEECRADILLTHQGRDLPESSARVIYLDLFDGTKDGDKQDPENLDNADNLDPVSKPGDLAYVIHTSGTTGKPKGVMIENRSVINFIKGITDLIPFTPADSILSLTTLSFDIFGLETILALLKGTRVIVGTGEEQINPFAFAAAMEREEVTIFQATPSRLQLIMAEEEPAKKLKQLKHLLVGGETFPEILLENLREITAGNTRIHNVYGPTETTIWSTVKEVTCEMELNVGKPIANTYTYIVNKSGALQPLEVRGELAIGGDGVARGYFNNHKLSAEKFLHNPFIPGEKMYMTGDLARWLPDGNIELFGRMDHQVKIRGFRIEPGEIENRLMEIDFISEAVVIVREEGEEKYLCAYLVPAKSQQPVIERITEIKNILTKQIPSYMLPSYFVELESIPLNVNGKIDRKMLPTPERTESGGYMAPANRTEETLLNIWSEVLNLSGDVIGVDGNFFDLGGNSIKVMRLAARIHKELDTRISLPEISARPFIRELAQYIKDTGPERFAPVEVAEKREYYPLAATQRGIFLQHRTQGGSRGYNMPQMMRLGTRCHRERLEESFIKLILRHESLRTSFELVNGQPSQRIHQQVDFRVEYFDAGDSADDSPATVENIFRDFIRPFDLAAPPLLRVGLIDTGNDEPLLMWDMHHIITDGVSLEIVGAELLKLYDGQQLPPLRVHYKDYCIWRNSTEITNKIQKQGEFWTSMFRDEVPLLKMSYDGIRPENKSFEGKHLRFTIREELCTGLNQLCRETGTTMYMLLLASYYILLAKYSRQQDIVVGSPVSGRNHGDLEQIAGMFVNMMALRCRPQGHKTFGEFLSEVKELVMDALENQDFHFQELVAHLGIRAESGRNPLFDVVFGMTTMDSPDHQTEGQDGIKMVQYGLDFAPCPFDLLLGANEKETTIEMMLSFSTDLFYPATAEKIGKHFIAVLEQAVANQNIKLCDISITQLLVAADSIIADDDQEEFNF